MLAGLSRTTSWSRIFSHRFGLRVCSVPEHVVKTFLLASVGRVDGMQKKILNY